MKSVLISIRPQWVEKIASGQKTIEVRKTAPQKVPFKAYIYETQGRTETPWIDEDGHFIYKGRGQVIGEFICDRIDEYKYVYCDHPEIGYPVGYDCGDNWYDIDDEDLQKACLTEEEFKRYGNGKPLYGWHIPDLKIYDKPKELSEFYIRKFDNNDYCSGCIHHETPITEYPCNDCRRDAFERKYLTRPPQSWQYIEDLGEEE